MPQASLAFVLHAHLPFVRHPAHEDFLEERWLAEAITETYIPLLEVLGALERDRVPTRLTLSLSPPLLAMLADPLLRGRYLRHLDRLVELAEKEERRTRTDERFHRVAEMYLARFCRARTIFLEDWGQDLIAAFRSYQERGLLEIITCAATHGFLPLLAVTPGAVRAQVEVAVAEHRRFFARSPEGFWLPECAYEPGLDAELARVGVRYFFVDTHGIALATPRPVYGVYAPIACDSGVAAFGRDPDSSKQVWSAEEGYPGDFWYRDFYRDIGFDLDYDYVRPYLPPTGQRILTGLKYHRQDRREGALRARACPRAARGARGALRRGPRPPGGLAGARHGSAADHRLPLRRRALRALVVRGAVVARGGAPPPRRHARAARRDPGRRPRPPPDRAARHAGRLHLGLEGLQRSLARGRERLALPPPPRHRGPSPRALSELPER